MKRKKEEKRKERRKEGNTDRHTWSSITQCCVSGRMRRKLPRTVLQH
jgi:hypothetical protein